MSSSSKLIFDKVMELAGDGQWIILAIFIILYIYFFVFRHYTEIVNFFQLRNKAELEVMEKLVNQISDKEYIKAHKVEMKRMYFFSLIGRKIYSESKMKVLLELLNKEILTKRDIKKYSYNFSEKSGKIKIKISIMDYLEVWYLRFISLVFGFLAILLLYMLNKASFGEGLIIVVEVSLLIFVCGASILTSFKVGNLKRLIKKIKLADMYFE